MCGAVRCGATRCGVVRRGAVWCDAVRCGFVHGRLTVVDTDGHVKHVGTYTAD